MKKRVSFITVGCKVNQFELYKKVFSLYMKL